MKTVLLSQKRYCLPSSGTGLRTIQHPHSDQEVEGNSGVFAAENENDTTLTQSEEFSLSITSVAACTKPGTWLLQNLMSQKSIFFEVVKSM